MTSAYLSGGQNLNFAVPAGQVHRLIRKRGKLRTLASAGGKRLDKAATQELDNLSAAMVKGDWRAAARILTRLRKTQKDNPLVWLYLGILHNQLGNYNIAIQHCKAAISLKPDYAGAYYNMGEAYRKLKRHPKAIAAYKKAIAIDPGYAALAASGYWIMGYRYLKVERRFPEAIAAYKRAIAIKPDYADGYFYMGTAYEALKRYPEAIDAYKKAIEIKPDFAKAYLNMGNVYYELNRHPEAIAVYKKAIAIDPTSNARYFTRLGRIGRMMKNYPEAITYFKKAILINPGEAEAYFEMGGVYESLKQYDDAVEAYDKAIALDPNGEIGRRARIGRASIRSTRRK